MTTLPTPSATLDDTALAVALAAQTGALARDFRRQPQARGLKPHALGDAADRLANDYLLDTLARCRADDRVLSEEAPDDRSRLGHGRVWIVDPLDGTRAYREGRDDWAVHVALVEEGRVIAAAVAEPEHGRVTASTVAPLRTESAQPQVLISHSRPPAFAPAVAQALGAELRPLGSAGCKAMAVLRGEAMAYIHAGGINEWDVAAPAGVVLARGLAVSDLHGRPLRFNQPDVVLHSGLIICPPQYQARVLAAIAASGTLGAAPQA